MAPLRPHLRAETGSTDQLVRVIEDKARRFGSISDLEPLIEKLARARVVMLGESSHGTHEFYDWRRLISQELIAHHGFNFISVEGDWPPCQRVNSYVQEGGDGGARPVLEHFKRWPTWMWANEEIILLAEWMRDWNAGRPLDERVGFHGLDVYSLFESIDAVLEQLEKINPFLARRARIRYSCFDRFHGDEKMYARSLVDIPEGCESQVLQTLQDLLQLRLSDLPYREAALFDARQNARIVKNAESYYRTMVFGPEDSWNVRDRHMMETLQILLDHYGPQSKAIIWEHNTHIGDYRATDMLEMGQVNIGGLAREHFGGNAVALVGFGTYQGSVIASRAWDGPIQNFPVPPAQSGSYEEAFHRVCESTGAHSLCLVFGEETRQGPLAEMRGHRAIGVVYSPLHERWGNYVPTSLAHRYDAFLFIDETRALKPLNVSFDRGEIPETWPVGQ